MAQLTSQFFGTILKMEGGYQNRPDDSGNYACGQLIGTNMGVSAVALRDWWNRCPSEEEMRTLTQSQAFNFYAWYFDRYNLYRIESQQLAELCMNNTMGSPAGAAKSEQRALNSLGYNVSVDGVRGAQTIAALNQAWRKNPAGIYNAIRAEWVKYLYSIDKPQFITGWMTRLNRFFPPISGGGTTIGIGLAAAILLAIYVARKA